jgi:hypothetical protein
VQAVDTLGTTISEASRLAEKVLRTVTSLAGAEILRRFDMRGRGQSDYGAKPENYNVTSNLTISLPVLAGLNETAIATSSLSLQS